MQPNQGSFYQFLIIICFTRFSGWRSEFPGSRVSDLQPRKDFAGGPWRSPNVTIMLPLLQWSRDNDAKIIRDRVGSSDPRIGVRKLRQVVSVLSQKSIALKVSMFTSKDTCFFVLVFAFYQLNMTLKWTCDNKEGKQQPWQDPPSRILGNAPVNQSNSISEMLSVMTPVRIIR